MSKKKIEVQNIAVSIVENEHGIFISLTDMLKAKDGDFFITDWLRNRNTLEFLSVWESMHNPDFNYGEFAIIKSQAGLNSFKISVKEWVEKTNAIGVNATSGRYGGTFAHQDIAFEFGTWISPTFKLYLIKEFQRLKEIESNQYNLEWNVRRVLSKVNYRLHTDSVKDYIIPKLRIDKVREGAIYANEADLFNLAIFGCTAKDLEEVANPKLALQNKNIRDFASINELTVLSNLENVNSLMTKEGIEPKIRFEKLQEIANFQLEKLKEHDFIKSLKKESESTYPLALAQQNKPEEKKGGFDTKPTGLLATVKPQKKHKGK